ncbi:MAG: TatD family hydrolase [Bacteroidaceae bacterium]|nr:TatD family hydrolase [Bacteroidaceae bacterium]
MDFFNIHTHIAKHPANEILSADVSSFSAIGKNEFLSVGIHPWYLDDAENQLDLLRKAIENKQVVAIGESGLDKLKGPSMDLQTTVFKKQIALSEEYHLPMIIHCVKAYNELIQIKKSTHPHQPWIIHGFRGKEALAKECILHGFHLSFGAYYQEDALRAVPIEKLFVETDESDMDIEDICLRIAHTRGMELEELTESIKKNVERVFFKP